MLVGDDRQEASLWKELKKVPFWINHQWGRRDWKYLDSKNWLIIQYRNISVRYMRNTWYSLSCCIFFKYVSCLNVAIGLIEMFVSSLVIWGGGWEGQSRPACRHLAGWDSFSSRWAGRLLSRSSKDFCCFPLVVFSAAASLFGVGKIPDTHNREGT